VFDLTDILLPLALAFLYAALFAASEWAMRRWPSRKRLRRAVARRRGRVS
jgi:HAMP domain-containing protein